MSFKVVGSGFSAFTPVLLHGDLWPTNVFLDQGSGRITGIIDFGDAAAGPPAWECALPGGKDDQWSNALAAAYVRLTGRDKSFVEEVAFYRMVRSVGLAAFTQRWAKPKFRDAVVQTSVEAATHAAAKRGIGR